MEIRKTPIYLAFIKLEKFRIMKNLIICSLVLLSLLSCKKSSTEPTRKDLKIKSISDAGQSTQFEYDEMGRVVRIYYNASSSLRLTYTPAGVNLQRLGSGEIVDPDRKTDFSIVNGRITNGTEFLPDKRSRRLNYGYDEEGKLNQIYILLQYDGNTYETHKYKLEYDEQNNSTGISFVRRDNNGLDNSDSIYVKKTWYEGKHFITWKDMGFDYFGTVAFGQQHLGTGITVPLYLASGIYPANNALKGEKTDNYYWNANTKKWAFKSTNSYTTSESEYSYDEKGHLIKYYGSAIEWQ